MDIYSSHIAKPHGVCTIADMENMPLFLPFTAQTLPLHSDGCFGFPLDIAAQYSQGPGNASLELYPTSLRIIFFSTCCPGPFQGWAPSWGRVTGMAWLTDAQRTSFLLPYGCLFLRLVSALFCFSSQHFKWAFKAGTERMFPVRRAVRRQMKEDIVSKAKRRAYRHGLCSAHRANEHCSHKVPWTVPN